MQTFVNIRLNDKQGERFIEGLRAKGFNAMPNDNTSYLMMKGKARLVIKEDHATDDLVIEQFVDEEVESELAQILIAVAQKFGGELIMKDDYGNQVHFKDKVDQIALVEQQVQAQVAQQAVAPAQPQAAQNTPSKVGTPIPGDVTAWMVEVANAITDMDQPRLDELLQHVPINANKIALNTLAAQANAAGLQFNLPAVPQAPQKPGNTDPETYKNMALNAMSKLMEGLSTGNLDHIDALVQVSRLGGAVSIWDLVTNGNSDPAMIQQITVETKNVIAQVKQDAANANAFAAGGGVGVTASTHMFVDEDEIAVAEEANNPFKVQLQNTIGAGHPFN